MSPVQSHRVRLLRLPFPGHAGALCLLLAAPALALGAPASLQGGHLVDAGGRALYTFDQDRPNTSTCVAQCAALWPPFYVPANVSAGAATGGFSHVRRPDGRLQWALRGKPLYYWLSDRKPGDATGEAVSGWHLVRSLAPASGR